MATKTRTAKSTPRQNQERQNRRSFDDLGKSASQVIQEAASVLEEELASGLTAARKVSRRLVEEQRVDKEDFVDALQRFRSTGHDLIEMVRGRVDDMGSESTRDLSQRFVKNAQGALDVFADLIEVGPELVNQLMKSNLGAAKKPRAQRAAGKKPSAKAGQASRSTAATGRSKRG
jgi:hypothetical protein